MEDQEPPYNDANDTLKIVIDDDNLPRTSRAHFDYIVSAAYEDGDGQTLSTISLACMCSLSFRKFAQKHDENLYTWSFKTSWGIGTRDCR